MSIHFCFIALLIIDIVIKQLYRNKYILVIFIEICPFSNCVFCGQMYFVARKHINMKSILLRLLTVH